MKRNIGLIPHHPAVVAGCDVENISRFHFNDAAIIHSGSGTARNHYADMLNLTALGSLRLADMERPPPSRLVGCTADGHAADLDQLKFTLLKCAYFIGIFEAF